MKEWNNSSELGVTPVNRKEGSAAWVAAALLRVLRWHRLTRLEFQCRQSRTQTDLFSVKQKGTDNYKMTGYVCEKASKLWTEFPCDEY